MKEPISPARLNRNVALLTSTRLVVNTSIRMIYPFLAIFAAGMSVEIGMISMALAISMATSAIGPFLAPVSDKLGRKTGMMIGLAIYLVGTSVAGLWPGYFTFFLSILLGNLGNNVFVPALQAYLGDHTPYEKRGLFMAISEVPWALSYILFVPLVGFIIQSSTWYAPFWYLSAAVAVMMGLIFWLIPNERPEPVGTGSMFGEIRLVLGYWPAIFGMLTGLLVLLGNESVNMVFGVWMQDSFGLEITALGVTSAFIGLSELSGEGVSAWLADHVGKEKAVYGSLILNSLVVMSLPWLGETKFGAMAWLFLFYFTFEVVLISVLPMMTEIMPRARATMMALFVAAGVMGRAIGDVIAPLLYQHGFWLNAGLCIIINILAAVTLSRVKLAKAAPVAGEAAE